jgi:hypothetical protein
VLRKLVYVAAALQQMRHCALQSARMPCQPFIILCLQVGRALRRNRTEFGRQAARNVVKLYESRGSVQSEDFRAALDKGLDFAAMVAAFCAERPDDDDNEATGAPFLTALSVWPVARCVAACHTILSSNVGCVPCRVAAVAAVATPLQSCSKSTVARLSHATHASLCIVCRRRSCGAFTRRLPGGCCQGLLRPPPV